MLDARDVVVLSLGRKFGSCSCSGSSRQSRRTGESVYSHWEQRRATNRQQSVRQCLCGYDAEIVLGVGGDWLTADARRGRSWMLPGCGKWRVHTPQGPKGEGPDRGRFDDLGQIKKNDGIVARLGWKSVRDVCVVTTADF